MNKAVNDNHDNDLSPPMETKDGRMVRLTRRQTELLLMAGDEPLAFQFVASNAREADAADIQVLIDCGFLTYYPDPGETTH